MTHYTQVSYVTLLSSLVLLTGCVSTNPTTNSNLNLNTNTDVSTNLNTNTVQPTVVVEPVIEPVTEDTTVVETTTLETITVYQVNADRTDYEPVTVAVDPSTLTVDSSGYRNYVNATGDIFVETPDAVGVFRPEGTDFWNGAPEDPLTTVDDGDFQDGLTEEEYEVMDAPIQAQIDAANEAANANN